jgi:hypothetical protein
MESIDKDLGKQLFVDEYGATCKTYLWKAITTKLCPQGQIVLAVASCGIAHCFYKELQYLTLFSYERTNKR